MESQITQDTQSREHSEGRMPVGKAETPPPTYEDACHYILTGRHPLSSNTDVLQEPPPDYPDDSFSIPLSSLDHRPQYVNLSSDQPENLSNNAQDTLVIASAEDFPRTCSICKKIAAYLVAIFWISICSIQLILGVGIANHFSKFAHEKLLLGGRYFNGENRYYGNAMFMFWMLTLFANIVLLFGIINKNRCNLLVWLMYNKMLMLLLLFSLFFPGIPFFNKDNSGNTDSRYTAKSNRFLVIITVVILYIGSIAVKLFYDQLDSRYGSYHSSDMATTGRSFPASWPINWSAYSNPTLRPIPNLLENNRNNRSNERMQSRRQRIHSRRIRRNDQTTMENV